MILALEKMDETDVQSLIRYGRNKMKCKNLFFHTIFYIMNKGAAKIKKRCQNVWNHKL